MKLEKHGHRVLLFVHPHRTYDYQEYVTHHREMIGWGEQFGADGMLCSTSSYDYFDPFLWAQYLCSGTNKLSPFIAVNPMYMHPYTAARMVASLTHLYGRKVWINLITGSAPADMLQIHDIYTKEERYERLAEFGEVMMQLLASQWPVNYQGKFYILEKSSLRTPISRDVFPEFTVAGESSGAQMVRDRLQVPLLGMLPSGELTAENTFNRSLAFGIIARKTREEAELASAQLYPESKFGQKLLKFSMAENETQWKNRVYKEMTGEMPSGVHYWLEPFKNKYADCPYILGSYKELADHLRPALEHQAHSFVLTIRNETEFEHIQKVFDLI